MKRKTKGFLVCFVSLIAIVGIFFIMTSNMKESIEENTSISG